MSVTRIMCPKCGRAQCYCSCPKPEAQSSLAQAAQWLKRPVSDETCGWEMRFGKKCGAPARYLLGHPDEDKVPICSLHQSRASTLGWPISDMRKNDRGRR